MRLRVILFALALAVALVPALALGAAEKGGRSTPP